MRKNMKMNMNTDSLELERRMADMVTRIGVMQTCVDRLSDTVIKLDSRIRLLEEWVRRDVQDRFVKILSEERHDSFTDKLVEKIMRDMGIVNK